MPGFLIANEQYSALTGFVFVFNLIVGTGALTLPAAFLKAGWALGLCIIIILAFVSFVTVTFVLEAMACTNAIVQHKRMKQLTRAIQVSQQSENEDDDDDVDDSDGETNEDAPLFTTTQEIMQSFPSMPETFYNLNEKIEMGEMANMVFNRVGQVMFYLCFVVYLYGDLAIYSAVVSKSLGDVICTYQPSENISCGDSLSPETQCWESLSITRLTVYRYLVGLFLLCLGPFTFFNVQKTKYLQIFTSLMRWIAFSIMITLAVKQLLEKGAQGHPVLARVKGLPALLGASVYSFMCHHSIPGLIHPIAGKNHIHRLLVLDYALIASFYLLLTLTGVFAFPQLVDLYTLVFNPRCATSGVEDTVVTRCIGYFLALFPVFTLSTSFPIIAVTLRNNLQSVFLGSSTAAYPWAVQHLAFPLLAVVPPVLVALISENVEILVRITGSFAGVGIQYVIPALLVFLSRKEVSKLPLGNACNPFSSPFRGTIWVVLVIVWASASVLLVFVNLVDS